MSMFNQWIHVEIVSERNPLLSAGYASWLRNAKLPRQKRKRKEYKEKILGQKNKSELASIANVARYHCVTPKFSVRVKELPSHHFLFSFVPLFPRYSRSTISCWLSCICRSFYLSHLPIINIQSRVMHDEKSRRVVFLRIATFTSFSWIFSAIKTPP